MRYIIAILALVNLASISLAQGHTTKLPFSSKPNIVSTTPARDFWFAIAQNYDPKSVSGEAFTLYITSPVNTTVNIQIQGQSVVQKAASANQVLTYALPKSLEMVRSSVVETDKAIHVWSNDGDITVYFMSRKDFTSDGSVVLPSYSYGKEYVVAAATALYVSPTVDLPSEFVVVATSDNTTVTIIPSQDIREEGMPAQVKYPKGIPFTVFLNKGECIQFQTTQSQDLPWDLSGSVISASEPVAVIGASACPFIPADPYCDFVMEMIPSIDRWGTKYFSKQFADRKYGGDSFLIIASREGQTIYLNDKQYATLGKFEIYLRDDIKGANVWTSNFPFLVAQYINGSTYAVPPGQTRNSGDPAMLVLTPIEQFLDSVTFLTPNIIPGSSQNPFTNYAHIFVPSASIKSTFLDGKQLTSYAGYIQTPVVGTDWEAFTIPNIAIGQHLLISNTGITAYVYGYSTDDSYAWGTTGAGNELKLDVFTSPNVESTSVHSLFIEPNPVFNSMKCNYFIPKAMTITLELFDVLGKRVQAVKTNEYHPAGTYNVEVDVSMLPSGSYICRLSGGSFVTSVSVKVQR